LIGTIGLTVTRQTLVKRKGTQIVWHLQTSKMEFLFGAVVSGCRTRYQKATLICHSLWSKTVFIVEQLLGCLFAACICSFKTESDGKRGKVAVERERRVDVLVHPRKGQTSLKWIEIWDIPICSTFFTAWHETHYVASKGGHPVSHRKKLFCYQATKAPSNTSTAKSTSSLPILSTSLTASQISSDCNSRVHYILRISQILTGRHPV